MQAYRWERQGWSGSRWTLVRDGQPVATLRRSGWTGSAKLSSGGQNWTLTASGVWTRRVRVADAAGREVAWAELRSNGVDLHGPLTGEATWRNTSWWKPAYELQAGGRTLATFRARSSRGDVEADPRAPGLVVSLALGWLGWLWTQDTMVAAVVAAT